ncbi:nose resistant to fluoxetine protein 6 [Lingula anatina]|uniref:Nose resistant to fluoxetine protein 6 n=1 Tax=Lingula anatina TaxID=7574 RepID=A0A1S3J2L8_LINAN|nr:nose resistant to fluoxetine protein 6 [Lingula anatina]|eukprot:XP_013404099.1 nose resistant to fluoxetine protein 6 [Lingula anatina]
MKTKHFVFCLSLVVVFSSLPNSVSAQGRGLGDLLKGYLDSDVVKNLLSPEYLGKVLTDLTSQLPQPLPAFAQNYKDAIIKAVVSQLNNTDQITTALNNAVPDVSKVGEQIIPLLASQGTAVADLVQSLTSGAGTGGGNPLAVLQNVDWDSLVQVALPSALNAVLQPISGYCAIDISYMLQGLVKTEGWALQMLDAFGKPNTGLLFGDTQWLGQYEQCLRVEAKIANSKISIPTGGGNHSFHGDYCKLSMPVPPALFAGAIDDGQEKVGDVADTVKLALGMCLPASCSSQDVNQIVKVLMNLTNAQDLAAGTTVVCDQDKRPDLSTDTRAQVCIAVLSVFGLVILVGTLLEGLGIDKTLTTAYAKKANESEVNKRRELGGTDNKAFVSEENHIEMTVVDNGVQKHGEANGDVTKHSMQTNGTAGKTKAAESAQQKTSKDPKAPLAIRLLTSFSLYSSLPRLLDTHQGRGAITCLNGIRVLSIGWVVLGHSYSYMVSTIGVFAANPLFAWDESTRFSFIAVTNAFFSVDSFFLLSGVLVAYLFLKQLTKQHGVRCKTMVLYYIHRYLRLSPIYFMLLFIYVTLKDYMGRGPLWRETGYDAEQCRNNWWTNILYINNFVFAKEACMSWCWYIDNDIQFYIVAPLFMLPLYWKPVVGLVILLLGLIANIIESYFTLAGLKAHSFFLGDDFYYHYYIIPWCRIGPYLIGLLVGFLLNKTQCKIKMNKYFVALGWIVSIACCTLLVFVKYDDVKNGPWSKEGSIMYEIISKPMWGFALGWIIIACATGHGVM